MKKVKISLQQTPNKTSSSLILTLRTINSIQQHSSLVPTMAESDSDYSDSGLPSLKPFLIPGFDYSSTQRNHVTQTSTPHDANVPVEAPIENAPDTESSQPESSNAQNTGSDPANPYTDAPTEEDLVSSETNFDTETSVDPDHNGPVEEPVESSLDPGPSQARISEAQSTGSDQVERKCSNGKCIRPRVPPFETCQTCREYRLANYR